MSKKKLKKIVKQLKGSSKMHKAQAKTLEKMSMEEDNLEEDLRKWVKQKWVDIGAPKKGGGYKPCGRQKGEKRKGYPKCVPAAKAARMSKGQKTSAVKRKRAAGNPGGKPTNVKTFTKRSKNMNEDIIRQLIEKKLCARGKAAAKSKFKVYPSAYANMYASAVCSGKVTPGGKKKRTNESTMRKGKKKGRCWAGYKAVGTPYAKGSCVKEGSYTRLTKRLTEVAAWQKKSGKDPKGGLNRKGVASYRAANPGSKLKMAVTTKPSKLKKGSKAANRRKSFCARMSGMRKRQKASNNTGKDRLSLSLKKWNC
jgi:hypothetical protein